MNIYVLERKERAGYDEVEGVVIVAPSEDAARLIANTDNGDEGKIWDDPAKVSCKIVDPNTEGIVLSSFRAG